MARFCVSCGSQISDETNVCSKCGQPAYQAAGGGTVAAPSAGTAGLTDNIAGMLAYVTIIPAIVFLLLEPYNRNRFIRFHSFQCIFLCIVLVAIHIVLLAVPIIGWAISIFVNLGFAGVVDCAVAEGVPGAEIQASGDRGSGGEASEHRLEIGNWDIR